MNVSSLPVASLPTSELANLDLKDPSAMSGKSYDSAIKEFEGVFVSLMLKEMRKTVGDGFFGSDSSDTLGGLFDMTLGQEIGQHGGLGIASALARYETVSHQNAPAPTAGETP